MGPEWDHPILISCNLGGLGVSLPNELDFPREQWPRIRVDTIDETYSAILIAPYGEVVRRCRFALPSSTPPWGATVIWADERMARFIVPDRPGEYEGGDLGLPTLAFR